MPAHTYGKKVDTYFVPPTPQYVEILHVNTTPQTVFSITIPENSFAVWEVRMVACGDSAAAQSTAWTRWTISRVGAADPTIIATDPVVAAVGNTVLSVKLDAGAGLVSVQSTANAGELAVSDVGISASGSHIITNSLP